MRVKDFFRLDKNKILVIALILLIDIVFMFFRKSDYFSESSSTLIVNILYTPLSGYIINSYTFFMLVLIYWYLLACVLTSLFRKGKN